MMAKIRAVMPYAVLCSLPIFAGMLCLVFWRSGVTYGAHFVFALHLHAFYYLALTLMLLPLPSWWNMLLIGWLLVYPVVALKRVHGLTWSVSVKRSFIIAVLHLMLQVVMLVGVVGIGLLTP